jgi:tail length tape measure protein
MSDDIAKPGIEIDSTQTVAGTKALDGLAASAATTEKQTTQLSNATDVLQKVMKTGSISAEEFRKSMGGGASSADDLAKKIQLLAEAERQLKSSSSATADAIVANGTKTVEAMNAVQGSTSLVTRELLVLGREALRGNWTRMAGSATILAQGFGVLGLILSPIGLGLIAIGAALGGVVYATVTAEDALNTFGATLFGLGALTGMNAEQMEALAEATAKSGSVTVGQAREMEASLIRFGVTNSAVISDAINSAQDYATVTGEKLPAAMTELSKALANPIEGVKIFNEKLNLLDAATSAYIIKMAEEGDVTGAQTLLMQKFAEQIHGAAVETGGLESGFHKAHLAASEFFAGVGNFFNPKHPDTSIFNYLPQEEQGPSAQVLAQQKQLGRTANDVANELTLDTQRNKLKADETLINKALTAGLIDQNLARRAEADIKTKLAALDKREAGPKPKKLKVDKVANRLKTLAAEADGNRQLANAYDASTAAGVRAVAMKNALADAAKEGGTASQFYQAELLKEVTAVEAAAGKYIEGLKEKADAQNAANKLMEDTGVSQQVANKQVADSAELLKIQAAAANATGVDILILNAQLYEAKQAQEALNESQAKAYSDDTLNKLKDQNGQLDVELSLINKTNRERAVQLALIKATQDLDKNGVTDPDARKQVLAQTQVTANKQVDLSSGVGDAIKTQEIYLKQLDQMVTRTKTATADMAASFGTLGKAIGDLTNVFAEYTDAQAKSQVERDKEIKSARDDQEVKTINAKFDRDNAVAQVKYYGDIASAASEFFGHKTLLYKVAKAEEEAFRLFEFAMSVEAMIKDTAETSTTVANNAVKTASNTATGASKMFAELGPFGFAAVVAMVAVLAAFGAGSGGGSQTGSTDFQTRQAAQGAGTVFGDPTAKSTSLTDAMTQATANQNKDLEFSSQMVTYLREINTNIGSLTNSIVQGLSAGGSLSTSKLNLGTTTSGPGLIKTLLSPLALILPGLFGSSTTNTLQDQGLKFNPQNLSSILSNGISGNTFDQVASETKSKFFGITISDKTKVNTTTGALDSDLSNQITALLGSLRNGVLSAASAIGLDGAKAALDAFTVDIGTVSFKDMTATQIQDTLNAVFGKVADQMASAVLGNLADFQKAGEGAFDTLTRIAREYQVVDVTLSSVGKSFATTGVASLKARDYLVGLFASIDDFVSATQAYHDAFLTPAEQLAPIAKAVNDEMTKLGFSSITTKDQFKALVQSIDTSTQAGADLYAALLQVAPAFAKVADAATQAANDNLTTAQNNVSTATTNLTNAYNAQSSALNTTITKFGAFSSSLKAFSQQLESGSLAQLSPQDAYNAAKAQFQQTAMAAQSGDETAIGNLQSVGQTFLTASQGYFASSQGYFTDLASVKAAVNQTASLADQTVNNAQAQLDQLTKQYDALLNINDSTLSVADAVKALQDALTAQASAQAVVDANSLHNAVLTDTITPPPQPTTPAAAIPAANANNPDVSAAIDQLNTNIGLLIVQNGAATQATRDALIDVSDAIGGTTRALRNLQQS